MRPLELIEIIRMLPEDTEATVEKHPEGFQILIKLPGSKRNENWTPSVGEKVRIIPSTPGDRDDHPVWVDKMDKTCGTIGKITSLDVDYLYVVSDEHQAWSWAYKKSWLLPVG